MRATILTTQTILTIATTPKTILTILTTPKTILTILTTQTILTYLYAQNNTNGQGNVIIPVPEALIQSIILLAIYPAPIAPLISGIGGMIIAKRSVIVKIFTSKTMCHSALNVMALHTSTVALLIALRVLISV